MKTRLHQLLLLLNTIVFVSSITCQRCVVKKIYDVEQPCGTCEGNQCYVLVYAYKYPLLAYTNAYQMDCIVSNSVTFPVGCRVNKDGNKLCICDDRDNCNTEQYPGVTSTTYLPSYVCSMQNYVANGTCSGNRCISSMNTIGLNTLGCTEAEGEVHNPIISSFDTFAYPSRILIPSNVCVYFKFTDDHSMIYCSMPRRIDPMEFDIPRNITCVTEAQFSLRETTCRSNFCFAARTTDNHTLYGCFSYGKSDTASFKPGLFSVGTSKLYICNTEFCNKYIDPDGNPREPRTYTAEDGTPSLSQGFSCACPASPRKISYRGGDPILSIILLFYFWFF